MKWLNTHFLLGNGYWANVRIHQPIANNHIRFCSVAYLIMMIEQPIPIVQKDDIERIANRNFLPEQVAQALSSLSKIQDLRIQAAVLKLANEDLQKLNDAIDEALFDYRNILLRVEYPNIEKNLFRIDKFSIEEQQKLVNADWKQYQEWFNKL